MKIQRDLVAIKAPPIRCQHGYMLRDGVHKLPELPFRPLAIFNVCSRNVPAHDASMTIAKRVGSSQEAAILSIFPRYANLCFPWLSACDSFLEFVLEGL